MNGSTTSEYEPIAIVDIVPYGDLVLQVSSDAGIARFKVSSQVLCIASPVFRAMLGPSSNFKEACELRAAAADAQPYVLSLGEDDPQALAVVLNALHLQGSKVPISISFQNLVDLAIICDKYDCAPGVTLWADVWTEVWKNYALEPGFERWLFIAWTFGIDEIFMSLSRKLILDGEFDTTNKTSLILKGHPMDDMLIPEPVMGKYLQSNPATQCAANLKIASILGQRSSTIRAMLQCTLSYIDRYTLAWGRTFCKSTRTEKCDTMILGSLVREFRAQGLIPTHDDFLLRSINDVEKTIKNLRIEFLESASVRKEPCTPWTLNGPPFCFVHREISNCPMTMVSHETTCSFLPELFDRIEDALSLIDGLSLDDFKSPEARSREIGTARWESLVYK